MPRLPATLGLLAALAVLAAPLAGCPEAANAHAPALPGPVAPSGRPTGPAAVDALSLRRPAGPEWFGLYLMGKKAGSTRVEVKREPRDGRDVMVVTSETLIQATVGDKTVARKVTEQRSYEARPAGRLLAFQAEWSGDGGDRTISGRCSPSGCTAQDKGQARVLGMVAETLDQAEGVRLAAARRA